MGRRGKNNIYSNSYAEMWSVNTLLSPWERGLLGVQSMMDCTKTAKFGVCSSLISKTLFVVGWAELICFLNLNSNLNKVKFPSHIITRCQEQDWSPTWQYLEIGGWWVDRASPAPDAVAVHNIIMIITQTPYYKIPHQFITDRIYVGIHVSVLKAYLRAEYPSLLTSYQNTINQKLTIDIN